MTDEERRAAERNLATSKDDPSAWCDLLRKLERAGEVAALHRTSWDAIEFCPEKEVVGEFHRIQSHAVLVVGDVPRDPYSRIHRFVSIIGPEGIKRTTVPVLTDSWNQPPPQPQLVPTRNNVFYLEKREPNDTWCAGLIDDNPFMDGGWSCTIEDIVETGDNSFFHSYQTSAPPGRTRRTLDAIRDNKGNGIPMHSSDSIRKSYYISWMLPLRGELYYEDVELGRIHRRRTYDRTIRIFPSHSIVDDKTAEDVRKAMRMIRGETVYPVKLVDVKIGSHTSNFPAKTTREFHDLRDAQKYARGLHGTRTAEEVQIMYSPFTPPSLRESLYFFQPNGTYFVSPYLMTYDTKEGKIESEYHPTLHNIKAAVPVSRWVYDSLVSPPIKCRVRKRSSHLQAKSH